MLHETGNIACKVKLPSFSLVLLCYNHEKYVEEALKSIFNQVYTGDLQYIIVNDASTDSTADIVQKFIADYSDRDVTFISHEINQGVAAATDTAMSHATKDWIILMDGDDIQYTDRCTKTADVIMRYPDAIAVVGSSDNINEKGQIMGQTGYAIGATWSNSPEEMAFSTIEERIRNYSYKHPQGIRLSLYAGLTATRRSLYQKWGNLLQPPCPKERFLQDPAWELRTMLSGQVVGTRKLVAKYRSHANNMLNKTYSKGFQGIVEAELFASDFSARFMYTYERQLLDLDRAERHPELTDFPIEALSFIRTHVIQKYNSYKMRTGWWKLSFFGRLSRAFMFRKKIDYHHRKWAWYRLLPLKVTCYLKYIARKLK